MGQITVRAEVPVLGLTPGQVTTVERTPFIESVLGRYLTEVTDAEPMPADTGSVKDTVVEGFDSGNHPAGRKRRGVEG